MMYIHSISKIISYPTENPFFKGSTIYLSGIDPLIYTEDLDQYDIDVVISLMGEYRKPDVLFIPPRIKHYYYQVFDLPDQDISYLFEPIYRIIYYALERNKNILIHCQAGISRSVSVLISFFISCLKYSPDYVLPYVPKRFPTWTDSFLSFIRENRPIANPNPGFMRQLYGYEEKMLYH